MFAPQFVKVQRKISIFGLKGWEKIQLLCSGDFEKRNLHQRKFCQVSSAFHRQCHFLHVCVDKGVEIVYAQNILACLKRLHSILTQ